MELLFAMPGIISIIIYIAVFVLAVGLIYWLVSQLPEPIRRYAIIVVVVIAAILVIYFLLQFAKGGSMGL